jgi:hypothetical protein
LVFAHLMNIGGRRCGGGLVKHGLLIAVHAGELEGEVEVPVGGHTLLRLLLLHAHVLSLPPGPEPASN